MLGVLRRIHRWLGLVLALPLILQGLSGSILALQPMVSDLIAPCEAAGDPPDAETIVALAQQAMPTSQRAVRYTPAACDDDLAFVQFIALSGGSVGPPTTVAVDPELLAVATHWQGPGGPLEWLRMFHTNLLLAEWSGRSIVGWIGIGLLLLAVLGLPLWWPRGGRWSEAFTFDAKASGAWFHRRLHAALGIWTVALLLVTACTGVVLAFPQTTRAALGIAATTGPRGVRPTGPPVSMDGLNAAIALARDALPGGTLRTVMLPARIGDATRVFITPAGREGAAAISIISVDAATRRIVARQDAASLSSAELTLRWMHDLHFGQGFGPLWRLFTVMTGLALPAFAVTGGAMWLLRQRRRRTLTNSIRQEAPHAN